MTENNVPEIMTATEVAAMLHSAPAAMVWKYIGELVFNMLVLVGTVKMSDRIVREIMGL